MLEEFLELGWETIEDALLSDKEEGLSLIADGLEPGEVLDQLDISSEEEESVQSGEMETNKELSAETEALWLQESCKRLSQTALTALEEEVLASLEGS